MFKPRTIIERRQGQSQDNEDHLSAPKTQLGGNLPSSLCPLQAMGVVTRDSKRMPKDIPKNASCKRSHPEPSPTHPASPADDRHYNLGRALPTAQVRLQPRWRRHLCMPCNTRASILDQPSNVNTPARSPITISMEKLIPDVPCPRAPKRRYPVPLVSHRHAASIPTARRLGRQPTITEFGADESTRPSRSVRITEVVPVIGIDRAGPTICRETSRRWARIGDGPRPREGGGEKKQTSW